MLEGYQNGAPLMPMLKIEPSLGLVVRTQVNCILDHPLLAAFALGLVTVGHAEDISSFGMTF